MINMTPSRNILLIVFLLTSIDSLMSDKALHICLQNIYSDFGYDQYNRPHNARLEMPKRALLKKVEDDFTNSDAKNYYDHIRSVVIHRDGMELPREFCFTHTEELMEYRRCVGLLLTMFLNSNEATKIIKDAFQNFKDSDAVNTYGYGLNYRRMYFYYMSTNLYFPEFGTQKLPFTPKEYCIFHQPDRDSNIMCDNALQTCLRNIYNEFDYKYKRPNHARRDMPIRAFLQLAENNFKNEDAMFYFKHIHDVMIPKENMQLSNEFCISETMGLIPLGDDIRTVEYETCLKVLNTTFLNLNDKKKVLRDAFWNFKDSDFTINDNKINYRYTYFHHLFDNMDFIQYEAKKFPMTPKEYCLYGKFEKNTSKQKHPVEQGEGTQNSNVVIRVTRTEDLI